MHRTEKQTKNPAQQAPSACLHSATSSHFQLSPKHILGSLNQTEFSTAAGLQAFSFFPHVLYWADNRLKRKDLAHSLSTHRLQLFQYGTFYSQSCISLYWWFSVHVTHTVPERKGQLYCEQGLELKPPLSSFIYHQFIGNSSSEGEGKHKT